MCIKVCMFNFAPYVANHANRLATWTMHFKVLKEAWRVAYWKLYAEQEEHMHHKYKF